MRTTHLYTTKQSGSAGFQHNNRQQAAVPWRATYIRVHYQVQPCTAMNSILNIITVGQKLNPSAGQSSQMFSELLPLCNSCGSMNRTDCGRFGDISPPVPPTSPSSPAAGSALFTCPGIISGHVSASSPFRRSLGSSNNSSGSIKRTERGRLGDASTPVPPPSPSSPTCPGIVSGDVSVSSPSTSILRRRLQSRLLHSVFFLLTTAGSCRPRCSCSVNSFF
mmetsp:Transcript_9739/g.17535  ORF Transcript_9739/g.17535 Transcript_9739/m.17535 type:complete len:221 (-) Transcript_9739:412-1074(-)